MQTVGDEGDLVPARRDSRGSSDGDRTMALEGHCDVPDTVTPTDTDMADDMTQRRSVSGSKQTDTQTQLLRNI